MNFIKFQKLLGKFMLVNFRLRFMFLFLVILCIIGVIFTLYQKPDIRLCFVDSPNVVQSQSVGNENSSSDLWGLEKLEDILLAKIQPTPGKSIFFHETSCPQLQNNLKTLNSIDKEAFHWHMVKLNARQACAIESAALHNPNSQVFVLFASPRYKYNNSNRNSSSVRDSEEALIDAILSYKNVQLRNLNLWTYAANTPIYDWLKDGALFKSSYVLSHISDFLRYLTLWRWGGTYLDMDIVMLRSMEDLPPNYTGAESNTHLAAGIMNFDSNGFGHEIAYQCLQNFQQTFDGSNWGNNGPGVITRVIKKICNTNNIELMMDTKRCMGFKVFGIDAFYAIPWRQWEHFFEPELVEQTMERTKNSYVAHIWNKHSIKRPIRVGTKCAYCLMAEMHCPRVYKAAGEYF
ncbi:hypothetical protein FF38_09861 [Lucilia cuprina]|uniref:Alpha 1,4-glycosyltransferase domain-containing protein n=1 Tax=Lucilia cuprina TaxID=7375 RepID=A0A0L0CMI0_LUCCU|nr:hypothetical protein FF38_09861 [Lucilia cuprina]